MTLSLSTEKWLAAPAFNRLQRMVLRKNLNWEGLKGKGVRI